MREARGQQAAARRAGFWSLTRAASRVEPRFEPETLHQGLHYSIRRRICLQCVRRPLKQPFHKLITFRTTKIVQGKIGAKEDVRSCPDGGESRPPRRFADANCAPNIPPVPPHVARNKFTTHIITCYPSPLFLHSHSRIPKSFDQMRTKNYRKSVVVSPQEGVFNRLAPVAYATVSLV